MLRLIAIAAMFAGLAPAQQEPVVIRDTGPLSSPESLQYPALHPIHIPKPTIVTLSNGLKIYLLEDHELPIVRGSMLVRTGNLFDPKDKRGLATLTGITMRSGGAAGMAGDQLNDTLESMAASVETSIAESTGTVRFHCLKENTDAVLGIMHDVVTAPAFRQDKIDLARLQLKSSISRRNDDAAGIASREIYRLVYGPDTPYGGQEEYATVDAVTRADIVAFYQRYFFPANILMSVYGDFSIPEMQKKLETLFGSWTVTQPKVPAFPKVELKPNPGIFFVEKTDINQTFFQMGELGGEIRDKDYAALSVAADVLGSGFSSRLLREVRTRLGYAYDISADWDADFDHPGMFAISGSTKAQSTTETIDATIQQIDKMRTAEITDQELKTAKDTALNSIVFEFERPSSTLSRLVTYDYFGYPEDFLARYQQAVAEVTKADVLRVAKQHFRPELLTIVAVGNEANFDRPLTTLSRPVKMLDVSIAPEPRSSQ
ncbi:MAG TPA: pitrilysin family protein [Bryobacteraceae bacterium]|jgi:zinc protease|nr:pitrilysin family protein [Bryobacteraceae bacterium]